MKQIISIKQIVSIFSIIILASGFQVAAAGPFEVSSVISEPYLNPGDTNVGILLTLQNNQSETLSKVKVHLYLSYPFSASVNPNNKLGELSFPGYLIGTGGSGEEYTQYFDITPNSVHKTIFKVDVDKGAKYGSYELPYSIYYEKGEYSGKVKILITGNTLVEIESISVDSMDAKVEPGEVFKLNVSLKNAGDTGIKWIKLALEPEDRGLVPLSSDSEFIFKDMSSGSVKETGFMFSLERNAQAKNYPINISLNYMDEKGNEYNENKLVGIVASGRASLEIAKKITEPARVTENEPFLLTIKIENTGTGDARGVTAALESELSGDTLAYLGEIKKDDYSNAIFTLDAAKSGKISGNLKINYEDEFGKHEVKKEVYLIVNPDTGLDPIPIVFGIGIIGMSIYYWKRKS